MKAEIRMFIDGAQVGQAESEHETAEACSAWLSSATAPIRRWDNPGPGAQALYDALKRNEEAHVADQSHEALTYVTIDGRFNLREIVRRIREAIICS